MMARAIDLATLNYGLTGQNPSVGCCIIDSYGHIVGEGVTGVGGRPHAEQIALDMAGQHARGGTAYVTLEPCGERSTGEDSCSVRLVDAGIQRVVCAIEDQHPLGRGGLAYLQQHNIKTLSGVGSNRAQWLYRAFFAGLRSDT